MGRGDGEMDRRLEGCRLKHTLLTQNSQRGEEERKPQGDEEIFEVTLRTSLKLFSCPEAKGGSVLYVWIWPHNFTFDDKV